jgi:hypothetical protein
MTTRIDLADNPLAAGIIEKEPHQVNRVRGVHQKAGPRMPECLDKRHLTNRAARDHVASRSVLPSESPLMPDHEECARFLAGRDHFVCRLKIECNRFLAENGSRTPQPRCFDRDWRMQVMMRAYAHNVRFLALQHLAKVDISIRDVELIGEPVGGVDRNIGASNEAYAWIGKVRPGVPVSHSPAADNGCAISGTR